MHSILQKTVRLRQADRQTEREGGETERKTDRMWERRERGRETHKGVGGKEQDRV